MATYINYIFTEEPIKELKERGFFIQSKDLSDEAGYVSSQIIFKDGTVYELREILDEELYLKKFKISRFEPRTLEENLKDAFSYSEHPNGIISLAPPKESHKVLESSNVRDYLKWRKPSPIKALTFFCKKLDEFDRLAHPEKKFEVNGFKYSLVHLGPNCIDLIVREKTQGSVIS